MTDEQELKSLLTHVLEQEMLILGTLSSPQKKEGISKVVIRPIVVKGQLNFQLTEMRQQQALHRNLSKDNCLNWFLENWINFKQIFLYTVEADYHLLVGKKKHFTILKKPPTKFLQGSTHHNRKKDYLWQEGVPVPFLVHLGIMNAEGKVYPAKQDKFRQINRFLEMIEDVLIHLDISKTLHVVDFGCGKAYLTFALYYFLKETKGYSVRMVGLDLKREVVQDCQELAHVLGYGQDLLFACEDINNFQSKEKVDMVVSLHACDTATDAALEKAIRWKASVILSVPCCQHEVMKQIRQEVLRPLLKHGIVKERFAALVTDAARAQLLEVLGYQTQILEFIDVESTPKNLLIRAIKRSQTDERYQNSAWQAYCEFKNTLNIDPSLERRFQNELKDPISF